MVDGEVDIKDRIKASLRNRFWERCMDSFMRVCRDRSRGWLLFVVGGGEWMPKMGIWGESGMRKEGS